MKIKKGDTVQVHRRQGQGRQGQGHRGLPETQRVLVEGVNRIKKHTKVSTTQRGAPAGRHRHARRPRST